MSTGHHSLPELFDQLGLESSEQAIDTFIHEHHINDKTIPLPRADFWKKNQSDFLEESWQDDGEWTYVVDELDTLLRD